MSLFDDDFYSPKVSRGDGRNQWGRKPRSRQIPSVVWMVGCLLLGVVLTWAAIAPGSSGSRGDTEQSNTGTPSPVNVQLAYNEQIVQAAGKVLPTVVSVISLVKDTGDEGFTEAGMGSGVIFKKDGKKALIVTNHHVIEIAEKVEVVLYDGEHREAEVVGTDFLTDLTVLSIDAREILQFAEFGDSTNLKSGEAAIAIGNPLGLGFSHTTTVGVISAPRRLLDVSVNGANNWKMDVIQTDAAINQGNSGGALVNLQGEVIGINSMKVLDMGVEGLGFAIPIDDAIPILNDLMLYGKVRRPYLGIYTQNVEELSNPEELNLPDDVNTGIIVLDASGPAGNAGLRTNDVIVALDGRAVHNTYDLRKYLYGDKRIGDDVIITYYRDGKKKETKATLTEWDPAE